MANFQNRTMADIAAHGGLFTRGHSPVTVYAKRPHEPSNAPGRRYAEAENLTMLLEACPELKDATVVHFSSFCNEYLFRVVLT